MDYGINDILEEEFDIIEVFIHEMDSYGHKGYYSFYDNINNGYIIYKEDDKWVVRLNDKRKPVMEKRYTNIYNLCLDILNDLKIDSFYFSRMDLSIPRGTRVIISKSSDCPVDEINEGIIIGSSLSRNNHQFERIYQVLGDNGEKYIGLYGLKIYGDICFRTMEDYIKDLKKQIEENRESIQFMHETNWELFLNLSEVLDRKNKYLDEASKNIKK